MKTLLLTLLLAVSAKAQNLTNTSLTSITNTATLSTNVHWLDRTWAYTNVAEIVITDTYFDRERTEWPRKFVSLPCPDSLPGCLVAHGQYVDMTDAKEKTVINETVFREVASFQWRGRTLSATNDAVWFDNRRKFVLNEKWEEVKR